MIWICFSAFTSLVPIFLCSLMLLFMSYFTLLMFLWFNFIWWICLLLLLKDVLSLSSQPSPFHSHPILLSRLLCLALLLLLGLQPSTRLPLCIFLLLVLSLLPCPSFTSSIINPFFPYHSSWVFFYSLFCLIVHTFFHGKPMPRVSLPVTAEAVTNCHWLPTLEKEHQCCWIKELKL